SRTCSRRISSCRLTLKSWTNAESKARSASDCRAVSRRFSRRYSAFRHPMAATNASAASTSVLPSTVAGRSRNSELFAIVVLRDEGDRELRVAVEDAPLDLATHEFVERVGGMLAL